MGGSLAVRRFNNLSYLEHRVHTMPDNENSFTTKDREALTGLVVEVRLRFDSLDQRLLRFETRLSKVEDNSVQRVDCGSSMRDAALRVERVEQIRVDAETVRAIELRVNRLEQERSSLASVADVNRAEKAVVEAHEAVEQAKTDVQSIKNRLAYMAGGLAAAVAVIEFAFKYVLK